MVIDELQRYRHIIENPGGIKNTIRYHFFKGNKMFHDFKTRHLFPKDLYNSEIRRAQRDVKLRLNIKKEMGFSRRNFGISPAIQHKKAYISVDDSERGFSNNSRLKGRLRSEMISDENINLTHTNIETK